MAENVKLKYGMDNGTIPYTPSGAVTAGTVVVLGDIIGIATRAIAANTRGTLSVRGIFTFAKATTSGSALTAGDTVYWDATNEVITTTAQGNTFAGHVHEAKADSASTVDVILSRTLV